MQTHLLNVGFGSFVVATRIVAIVSPGSAPIKRLKEVARDQGRLIDVTYGRKARSIVVTDSNHVILSAVNPETAALRLMGKKIVDQVEVDATETAIEPEEMENEQE